MPSPTLWKKLLSQLPWGSEKKKHSLGFLNATQFLGVVNDNLFKLAVAFLLIDVLGKESAPRVLSIAGAIYVLPFLLFSSSAGILADRFSKQKLLVFMKAAEILIMTLAVFAFWLRVEWASYTLLFCLSTHSAMFGPSKYGIIPEIVTAERVPKANGLITSFTYLATIAGTFLAAFLTEITDKNFVLLAGFCLLVAMVGFGCSFGITRTPAQGSQKKINILFAREIFQTLVFCRSIKYLLAAIFGSAYFLFIGAFTQLNIIPFAIQSLSLSEVAGGYLFLSTALGIALGSFIVGKVLKKKVELGLSCLAGFCICLLFFCLRMFSQDLTTVIITLFLIGVAGGVFIVPLDSFIQLNSPNERRGQVIAAANFLSFFGVLLASIALYLFSQIFDLSSASGFALVGITTFLASVALTFRLSEMTLPYFSRKFLFPLLHFQPPQLMEFSENSRVLLVLPKGPWHQLFLLNGSIPNLHFFFSQENRCFFSRLLSLSPSCHTMPAELSQEDLTKVVSEAKNNKAIPCLFLDKELPSHFLKSQGGLLDFFKRSALQIYFVSFQEKTGSSPYTFSLSQKPPQKEELS